MQSLKAHLEPKIDVVLVEKNTRGRFPGPRAKKDTIGLVWSTWVSNSTWGTQKVSLLSESGSISFSTMKCLSKIGTFKEFKNLVVAYDKYVEKEYIPVFASAEASPRDKSLVSLKILGFDTIVHTNRSTIKKEDLLYILNNPDKQTYSVQIEPWVLKKWNII
jgi:hypothetical protein